MSLKAHCTPRPSVFATDRRATVLNLDSFLKGQVHGTEFFEENYFTNGMTSLVDRVFRQLSGSVSGSSIFSLSQAMGGGKTHSMIALGLLARDPVLRKKVLAEKDPAPKLKKCRVIGFNGRRSDAPGGIWGDLAEQLGKSEQFAAYVSPILKAPGPESWKQLLNGDPLIIFLDELPPYLEYATAVPVGGAHLGTVTTTALANLFVAVTELDNVCLVLSDLAGTNYSVGQDSLQAAFDRSVQGIASEAKRVAVPITPVNPNGDELYHILRRRLFQTTAGTAEIERVAAAYREALREASRMNLTTSSPDALYTRVIDAYPFHPDLRELVGKFRENEGFQQTRGVIRLMQMVVSSLWRSERAGNMELIHPYDVDLNADELSSEIRTINPSLAEAIAHDVARGGDSEVEMIDAANGNSDASDAARLILIASLSTTPGAIHGLREYQLVDCLQRPGRDLSTFKANVLDKLSTRAWYLHTSADGRLFFKNQQNLAAKLRSQALALHVEVVDRMLRTTLDSFFVPTLKDCYQIVKVLPPLDEVQVEQDRTTLVIVRPGHQANQLPISQDWQQWWEQQQYKNRILFLSGSRDTYQKVLDAARQARALESIEDDLRTEQTPADDPQWRALDQLRDRIQLQFRAALKEAFDQVVYPSINAALRAAGIELAFAGNQNGEATIRKTLEAGQKFTTAIADDGFRSKAEARLFGSAETKVVLWSDFKRNAAVLTTWPLHKPSALDDLKTESLRRGLWREEGNHIRRGPFPPPTPTVEIRELSMDDGDSGSTYLKVEALNAPMLVFETADTDPTPSSSPVPTPARFEARGLSYRFLACDPAAPDRVSAVKVWQATLRLKHQLIPRGDHFAVELKALPAAAGIVIRYTTDASSPTATTAATYDGPITVPPGTRMVLAVATAPAQGLTSEIIRVAIPQKGEGGPKIDPQKPARWRCAQKLADSGQVWDFIQKLRDAADVKAHSVEVTAESDGGQQHVEFSGALDAGYTAQTLQQMVQHLQDLFNANSLRMSVSELAFSSGQALLDWSKRHNQPVDPLKVKQ